MSYNEKLNEQEKSLAAAYEKAQKELAGLRLKATLYDTAQAIVDADPTRVGETVAEVVINTNTGTPISEILEKAEQVLEDSKKAPATKTVYTVMFCAMDVDDNVYQTWPARDLSDNQYSSITQAADAAVKCFLALSPVKSDGASRRRVFYYIKESQVAA